MYIAMYIKKRFKSWPLWLSHPIRKFESRQLQPTDKGWRFFVARKHGSHFDDAQHATQQHDVQEVAHHGPPRFHVDNQNPGLFEAHKNPSFHWRHQPGTIAQASNWRRESLPRITTCLERFDPSQLGSNRHFDMLGWSSTAPVVRSFKIL